jgi:16S rRNA C1402 N4-methylase RsmH
MSKKNFNNYKKKIQLPKLFKAIRIFVNPELSELMLGLTAATKILSDGGLLIVVSFHSLEDKIVKNFSLYILIRIKTPQGITAK